MLDVHLPDASLDMAGLVQRGSAGAGIQSGLSETGTGAHSRGPDGGHSLRENRWHGVAWRARAAVHWHAYAAICSVALFLWFPRVIWVAEWIYGCVSRNRHLLSRVFGCKGACAIVAQRERDGELTTKPAEK